MKGIGAEESAESRLLRRIQARGRGVVFTPRTLLDLGTRRSIDVALHRLVKKGHIRRLARGLYHYPRSHPKMGELSPSIEAVAAALAGRDRLRLLPSGAYAANLLRLSDQVPMKVVFLTDGPSRRVTVGRRRIVFKRTTPRNMAAAGRASGPVIQALRHLGKTNVTMDRLAHLRTKLSRKDRRQLAADLALAPAWMHPFMHAIAEEESRK